MKVIFTLVVMCMVVWSPHFDAAPAPVASSPVSVAVSDDGTILYAAEKDARRITVLDAVNGDILRTFQLDMEPAGVAVSADGTTLYVTGGGQHGRLVEIDVLNGVVRNDVVIGHTPVSPVLSPNGDLVYIPDRFDDEVAVYDSVNDSLYAAIPAIREPVAVALTPDGGTLVIANHLPGTRQIPEYMTDGGWMSLAGYDHGTDYSVSSVILVADTRTMRLTHMIHLPNGSTGLRGICISPDGRYAYVTHILARYQLPTTQLERGWMNTNAVSVIDLDTCRLVNTVLLDDILEGAANPWGIACSSDGSYLVVTHAGTHEVSILDRTALHHRLDGAAAGLVVTEVTTDSSDVVRDLSFLTGIRHRIKLEGNGPRAVTVFGQRAFVAGYFSDTVEAYSLADGGKVWSALLHEPGPLTEQRLGERAFNDASFCFESWQSCASCHPDARADGLNWDLLNDGIGSPKNTKSLLYSHRTPPVMVTGIRDSAEVAVRAGLRYIQFAEHPESDAVAIDTYLKSLEPVTSPYLDDPDFRSAAERGERVFVDAGCASCHPSPLFTDLASYNVDTGAGRERGIAFDTPALVELWRTGPYLYDGQAKYIDQILHDFNRKDHHGVTSSLEMNQQYELICYLLSL